MKRGSPRFLLADNEVASEGIKYIVFTGKPGIVARLQTFPTAALAADYLTELDAEVLARAFGPHVIEFVHIINPSTDYSTEKLTRILDRMCSWYRGVVLKNSPE